LFSCADIGVVARMTSKKGRKSLPLRVLPLRKGECVFFFLKNLVGFTIDVHEKIW